LRNRLPFSSSRRLAWPAFSSLEDFILVGVNFVPVVSIGKVDPNLQWALNLKKSQA